MTSRLSRSRSGQNELKIFAVKTSAGTPKNFKRELIGKTVLVFCRGGFYILPHICTGTKTIFDSRTDGEATHCRRAGRFGTPKAHRFASGNPRFTPAAHLHGNKMKFDARTDGEATRCRRAGRFGTPKAHRFASGNPRFTPAVNLHGNRYEI